MNKQEEKKLRNAMKKHGLAAMLICPSPLLTLLTGHASGMCERFQGLFLPSEGEAFYICNKLYQQEIADSMPDVECYIWSDGESMTDAVGAALREHGLTAALIGVNSSAPAFTLIDIARSCGVRFVNGVKILDEARIIKSERELEALRTAARIADSAFDDVLNFIRPGITEGEIQTFLYERMRAAGGSICWGIIASGPNAALPHYYGTQRRLETGDCLIMDYGCSYNGLFSDISRTVFIGNPTDEAREIYEIVLRAQKAAENTAVDKAFIPDVDAAARNIISAAGYGEHFISRLGHGIGYMLHEEPYIQADNCRRLERGMVFSVEPGIYLPGKMGVRIEDIVAVTSEGNEILNHASKELIIL